MAKNQRPSGLGRGLGSLISTDTAPSASPDSPWQELAVGDIVPNTFQPRHNFDEDALVALSASIGELGVLQPVLVRARPDKTFELIAGERRWRAAKRAGLERIPAIVREVDDETSLAHAIVENVQRAELNAIEEAAAFQQLIDDFDLTQDQVATRVGRSRPAIANALRLLQLPTDVQRLVIEGRLSAGHGRVLVSVDNDARASLVERVLDEGLSVRQLERLAKGESIDPPALGESPTPSTDGAGATNRTGADGGRDGGGDGDKDRPPVGTTKHPALLELEQLLGEHFSTSVAISMGAKRGRMVIDFADIDDLERIYSLIATLNQD